MSKQEYELSDQIFHHEKAVRSITFSSNNNINTLLSCSLDKSCSFFSKTDLEKNFSFTKKSNLHDEYAFKVHSLLNNKGFLTAGKDKRIIQMDNEGNPIQEFIGHEGPVCSISQYSDSIFVSGSWDGTARLWNIVNGTVLGVLKDHSHAVCVSAFPDNMYITGSQDKRLRFWIKDHNTKNVDSAHEDIIRHIEPTLDYKNFYTCSNDCTIKYWNLYGQMILTLNGHDGFIFRVLSYGDFLFSCGDDKTLKVWYNNTFIKDLFHPNTVWDVCVDKKEGDVITACGDGVIRVYSSNKQKWLSQKEIDIYYNDCFNLDEEGKEGKKVSSNPKPSDLPLIDYIYKNKGKEGEIKAFNNKGKGEAWMVKEGKWEKIGDLLDSSEEVNENSALNQKGNCTSTIGSKHYEGDSFFPAGEYDFIFDVELDSIIRRLPFNINGNKLVSAEKFCRREKLHVMYQQDIIKFLNQNAQSKPIQKQIPQSKPSNRRNLSLIKLPLISYSLYSQLNIEGPLKKLQDDTDSSMIDIKTVSNILKKVKEINFYHTSKFNDNEKQALCRLISYGINSNHMIYVLDILRMICLHPQSNEIFKGEAVVLMYSLIVKSFNSINVNETIRIISLRALSNLCSIESGRVFLQSKSVDLLNELSSNLEFLVKNKNIKSGLCSVLFNLSIIFYDKNNSEVTVHIITLINECIEVIGNGDLEGSSDEEVKIVLNLLYAIGNFAFFSKENLVLIKELEVDLNIKTLLCKMNTVNDALFIEMKEFLEEILNISYI